LSHADIFLLGGQSAFWTGKYTENRATPIFFIQRSSENFGEINITWTPFCVVHRKEFLDDDFTSAHSVDDWLFASHRSTHSLTDGDRRCESGDDHTPPVPILTFDRRRA
jgi:hypothetical protein